MSTLSAPPAAVVPYRNDLQDVRRFRRCAFTGAFYTFIGVVLLWPMMGLVRSVTFQPSLAAFVRAVRDTRHPEGLLSYILVATALLDSVGGILLMVFTLQWRRLLTAILASTIFVHGLGVSLAIIMIARDDLRAQWGGMMTIFGLVVGVPYALMLTLGVFALCRVVRARSAQ